MSSVYCNNHSFYGRFLFLDYCITSHVVFHNPVFPYLTIVLIFLRSVILLRAITTFHISFLYRFSIFGISQHFLCSANTFTCLPPPAFVTNYTRHMYTCHSCVCSAVKYNILRDFSSSIAHVVGP